MAAYHDELLLAARLLVRREPGDRGRLPRARVRRSVSTAYYALFQFLLNDAAVRIIGTHHPLQTRRRLFMRLFTHTGVLSTMRKVSGRMVDGSVAEFLRWEARSGTLPTPSFARDMAAAFIDAQAKRHDADYDLDENLPLADALALLDRVEAVMMVWTAARSSVDRDFKHALLLLMLQKGALRSDRYLRGPGNHARNTRSLSARAPRSTAQPTV